MKQQADAEHHLKQYQDCHTDPSSQIVNASVSFSGVCDIRVAKLLCSRSVVGISFLENFDPIKAGPTDIHEDQSELYTMYDRVSLTA